VRRAELLDCRYIVARLIAKLRGDRLYNIGGQTLGMPPEQILDHGLATRRRPPSRSLGLTHITGGKPNDILMSINRFFI
jgi:hypothetical protein